MSGIAVSHIARIGLLTAFSIVSICLFRVSGPDGRLYFHLGETVILASAVLLGKKQGAFVGAISAALADLLLGATQWAPFSFLIHGAEAWLAGALSDGKGHGRDLFAMLAGVFLMIVCYAVMAGFLYGFAVVWVEILGDVMQGLLGIATAFPFVRLAARRFPWLLSGGEER